MNVYMFQAALLCEDCGKATCEQLRASIQALHPEFDEGNESSFDSDDYPKGPYSNGGGEADGPQVCDHCGTFLQNPLTPDGVTYTLDLLKNYISAEDETFNESNYVADRLNDEAKGLRLNGFKGWDAEKVERVAQSRECMAEWVDFYSGALSEEFEKDKVT